MEIKRIEEQNISRWSGGTTTQLAIWPPEAVYADRDFLWRLSTATVDDPDSTFTPLPDYNRFIAVREGMMRLCHGGDGVWKVLTPGKIDLFDGGVETVSHGVVTDFNLMVRKGKGPGALGFLALEEGMKGELGDLYHIRESVREMTEDLCRKTETFFGLYLAAGADVVLTADGEEKVLHNGDLVLWLPGEDWQTCTLTATGETDTYGVWVEV